MAKSVRYSCANAQKPFSIKSGHFVVINAVIIMIKGGIENNRINKPIRINKLHSISNAAVKYAQNSGWPKPIFENRPGPSNSGNKNFWIPSERKIKPTSALIIMVLLSSNVLIISVLKFLDIFRILLINNLLSVSKILNSVNSLTQK